MATYSWSAPGSYTYSKPNDLEKLVVTLAGAEGAYATPSNETRGTPGKGGRIVGVIDAADIPSTMEVRVGGEGGQISGDNGDAPGGYNGGGDAERNFYDRDFAGGGGGGASDIRADGGDLSTRLAVAAGGGGGSVVEITNNVGNAGDGGALQGEDGGGNFDNSCSSYVPYGKGGTQTSGGEGGSGCFGGDINGGNGSLGTGGYGVSNGGTNDEWIPCSGGGGAGYYGGGAGAVREDDWASGSAGGSNGMLASSGSITTNERGTQSGDGYVELEEVFQQPTAPTASSVLETHSRVLIEWGSVALAETYHVYRSTTSGSGYSEIAVLSAGNTSYADTNVDTGQTYYYVVTANNDGAESNNSNEVSEFVAAFVKVDDNGQFVDAPLRYYNGSSWVYPPAHHFDSSTFEDI